MQYSADVEVSFRHGFTGNPSLGTSASFPVDAGSWEYVGVAAFVPVKPLAGSVIADGEELSAVDATASGLGVEYKVLEDEVGAFAEVSVPVLAWCLESNAAGRYGVAQMIRMVNMAARTKRMRYLRGTDSSL